jgi:hypothetical protein
MRVRALVMLVLGLALAAGAGTSTTSASSSALTVTFVGDSVPDAITYVPMARRRLGRGLVLRLDLRVCRRLVQPSCSFQGSAPTTALQAVRSYGRGLGRVLVVDVGYNEGPIGYGLGIDDVMRAALAQNAAGVVWVTLRETRDLYRQTNEAIRRARRRWPELEIADWNAFSAGKPWFAGDGLHLTPTGAVELAAFLRPYVLRAGER